MIIVKTKYNLQNMHCGHVLLLSECHFVSRGAVRYWFLSHFHNSPVIDDLGAHGV